MKKTLFTLILLFPYLSFSQCFISYLDVNVGPCNPVDNLFDLTGELQFTNPPSTGQLIVEDCNGNQAVYNAPFTSPLMYSIPDILSDGTMGCSVSAYFTDASGCSLSSVTYNNPASCSLCSAEIGTYSHNITGSSSLTDPWYLCFGDVLNISANGDFQEPDDASSYFPSITYDPGLWLFIYACAPYISVPIEINLDSCLLGIWSTDNGVWQITNNIGDGSTYWFRPITMYSMMDGIYAVSINGSEWCYDAGQAYEVTFLEEILVNEVIDVGTGTITVTASGGMPAANGSSFTISNVLPPTAVLSQDTLMNDSSMVISNLQSGQFYQYTITDDAGCSVTIGDPDPFVGNPELEMGMFVVYPNPTSGSFTVQSNLDGELIIRDLAGRQIKKGKTNQEVDLSDQPNGVYFVFAENQVLKVRVQR